MIYKKRIFALFQEKSVVLAKDSKKISVWDVLDAVKGTQSERTLPSELFNEYEATRQSTHNSSLYDLVHSGNVAWKKDKKRKDSPLSIAR